MTHGATFLKGNYELPRGPVKLSRERWNRLADFWVQMLIPGEPILSIGTNHLSVTRPVKIDGVIFLPAEYVPEQACAI